MGKNWILIGKKSDFDRKKIGFCSENNRILIGKKRILMGKNQILIDFDRKKWDFDREKIGF